MDVLKKKMQKNFFKANFLYLVGNKASSCIPAWFGSHADLQTQQVCPLKMGFYHTQPSLELPHVWS